MIRFLDIRRHPELPLDKEAEQRHLYLSLFFPAVLVVLIWVVKLFELGSGLDMSFLGVFPRRLEGLLGILTAPLVHQDLQHTLSNSAPLLVLGFLLYNSYRKVAVQTVIFIWLFTGVGIWLLGRPAWHIGASGVVFGINFFLFFSGVFRLELRSIALALLVAFAYGGMVWGIFPIDLKISYEAHALGALAGVVSAWFFRNVDRAPEVVWEEEEEPQTPWPEPGSTVPYPYQSIRYVIKPRADVPGSAGAPTAEAPREPNSPGSASDERPNPGPEIPDGPYGSDEPEGSKGPDGSYSWDGSASSSST